MGTNVINPESILEQIRRARLYNPNLGQAPQAQAPQGLPQPQIPQIPTLAPTQAELSPQSVPGTAIQAPQPVTEQDKALSQYRQTMQEKEPSQADYHPSVLRRIIGGALGAGVGLTNPQAGGQLAHQIVYGPLDRQTSEYQKRKANAKEVYETESGAESNEAKTQEQVAQKEAEVERAKAEEARAARERWQVSPPGQAAKLAQVVAAHPKKSKDIHIMNANDKDGNPINVYNDPETNQLMNYDTKKPLGSDDYDHSTLRDVGTTLPKKESDKPPREGEAGFLDKRAKELGHELSSAEQLQAHKDYEASGRKETVTDPEAASFRRDYQLNLAKQNANKQYSTQFIQATQHLEKVDQARTLIATGNPESIALAVPNVLTALISGQGTGVRITQAEMNSIIYARGWGESIEAMTNKILGFGSLGTKEKRDLAGILDDVKAKITEKQKILSGTMDKIDNAKDLPSISKAHIEHRKAILGEDKSSEKEETVSYKGKSIPRKVTKDGATYIFNDKTQKYDPQEKQ